jgi:two-component system response regulator VanR
VTNAVNNLTHILVVDNEKELADVPELYLTNDGYAVHKCCTGAEDRDKIMGLTIGADDCITKFFNPLEVVARVKARQKELWGDVH